MILISALASFHHEKPRPWIGPGLNVVGGRCGQDPHAALHLAVLAIVPEHDTVVVRVPCFTSMVVQAVSGFLAEAAGEADCLA